jgi:hypothetical protein
LQREREQSRAIAQDLAKAQGEIGARDNTIVSLQERLRQERSRAESALATSASAQAELENLKSQNDQLSPLQVAVQRERERADGAVATVAAVKQELDTLKGQNGKTAEKVAELENALQQERRRADAAVASVAAAKQELDAREGQNGRAAEKVAELENALQQERRRADTLARDYEAAKDKGSITASLQVQVADLQKTLDAEREERGAAVRQLTTANGQIAELENQIAGLEDKVRAATALESALQQEHDRNAVMSQNLAFARTQNGMLRNRIAELTEDALKRERERSANADRNASAVQMGFEAFSSRDRVTLLQANLDAMPLAFAAMTPDSGKPQSNSADRALSARFPMAALLYPGRGGETAAAPTTASIAPTAEPSALSGPSEVGAITTPASISSDPIRSSTTSTIVPSATKETARPVEPALPPTEATLLGRADALIRSGDVSGARLLLERATTGGSAQAAFRLGETYDPGMLSKWGTLGIHGDAALARELYSKASKGGVKQAAERLEALK